MLRCKSEFVGEELRLSKPGCIRTRVPECQRPSDVNRAATAFVVCDRVLYGEVDEFWVASGARLMPSPPVSCSAAARCRSGGLGRLQSAGLQQVLQHGRGDIVIGIGHVFAQAAGDQPGDQFTRLRLIDCQGGDAAIDQHDRAPQSFLQERPVPLEREAVLEVTLKTRPSARQAFTAMKSDRSCTLSRTSGQLRTNFRGMSAFE